MAKSVGTKVMLESEEGPTHRYYVKVNPRTQTEKLRLRKYNPYARKHMWYSQKKLPNPKKQ